MCFLLFCVGIIKWFKRLGSGVKSQVFHLVNTRSLAIYLTRVKFHSVAKVLPQRGVGFSEMIVKCSWHVFWHKCSIILVFIGILILWAVWRVIPLCLYWWILSYLFIVLSQIQTLVEAGGTGAARVCLPGSVSLVCCLNWGRDAPFRTKYQSSSRSLLFLFLSWECQCVGIWCILKGFILGVISNSFKSKKNKNNAHCYLPGFFSCWNFSRVIVAFSFLPLPCPLHSVY